jgi:hypothetical protein
VTCGRGIDDGEASMAQAHAVAGIVDGFRQPNALIVTTAMLDAFEHWANQRFRIAAYEAGDATHKSNLVSKPFAERI